MQIDPKFTNAAQVVSHEHVSVDLKAEGPPGKEEVGETGVSRDGFRFPPISPNIITLFFLLFFTFSYI